MKFLTILIILFFYRNWHGDNPVRRKVSFYSLNQWAMSSSLPTNWRYLVAVGGPGLVLLVVACSLEGALQGLIWLLLSLVVLVFCLDLHDVEGEFDEHSSRLSAVTDDDDLADVVQIQEDFQIDHLHGMFQSVVPSLFWFLILGPAGALVYALSIIYQGQLDEQDPEAEFVDRAVYWLEWVPVRISGLLFCFAGNFGPTFDYWLNQLADTQESTACHLTTMAGLASEVPDEHDDSVTGFAIFAKAHVREMRYLCDRALFGWLGVAALVTILNG
jgi:membrane protein required for beta-lactamase induction